MSGENAPSGNEKKKSTKGFGSMNKEKQREIAQKGGRAAHVKGTAHEFTKEEARVAGHKGGVSVSRNREHMVEIGRRGGEVKGKNSRTARMVNPPAPGHRNKK